MTETPAHEHPDPDRTHPATAPSASAQVPCGLGAAWWGLYQTLIPASEALVAALPVERDSHLGGALQFFFYDTPKVLLLLTGVVFVMGMVNTYFTPERTRALLAGRTEAWPTSWPRRWAWSRRFAPARRCRCSSASCRPACHLGVTFSFLVTAPMVDTVALTLLLSLFGWKIAALYLGFGMALGVVAGLVIGALKQEQHLEDWVREMPEVSADVDTQQLTLADRIAAGMASVREIVGKVWPYVLGGIAVGAGIHGFVPQEFLASFMGKDAAWWSLPLAVLMGVPMYANTAGILPVIEALTAKGAAMGTALAFMMSVVALSLPEMIILRKVLKLRLIATFVGIVATGILRWASSSTRFCERAACHKSWHTLHGKPLTRSNRHTGRPGARRPAQAVEVGFKPVAPTTSTPTSATPRAAPTTTKASTPTSAWWSHRPGRC